MHTKLAKDIVPGDTIYLDDNRPVRVTEVGKGFFPGSVLIGFEQPKGNGEVSPPWSCVGRNVPVWTDVPASGS